MKMKLHVMCVNYLLIWNLIIGSFIFCSCQKQLSQNINNSNKIWATGYLPGYRHTDNAIPFMTDDDYKFLTHIIHHGGIPKPDGSIDIERLGMETRKRKIAVELAHAAGKPILFCVVGEFQIFNPVITNLETRRDFINNLLLIMDSSGYDGIDLDMEPVCAPFGSFDYNGINLIKHPEYTTEFPVNYSYIALVKELRTELNKRKTPLLDRPLLTAAITWRDRHIFGDEAVHSCFDQINLMTYDMCGPQDGEVTWFDSPIYNGGFQFPKYNRPAYSIEMFVNDCIEVGIPAKKLGIGICLDALVWKGGEGVLATGGVTAPRQTWSKAPTHPHQGAQRYTYSEMMNNYYSTENYYWDEKSLSPYLSIDQPGSSGDMFISFNDERSIKEKIEYLKYRGLGGFIIWELSADYRPDQPEGEQRPLRKAMQVALGSNNGNNKNE
jgi:chitinase